MKMTSSRTLYLQGLRLLWSSGPVDQALMRGQISEEEHQAILESITRKQQAREHLRTNWIVNDACGCEVGEISRRRDGTFSVRALHDFVSEPVLMTSEEQCYQWIDALPHTAKSRAPYPHDFERQPEGSTPLLAQPAIR
jgi:hypothetical protein